MAPRDILVDLFEQLQEMGYNSFEELHEAGYVCVIEGGEACIKKREDVYG